MTDFTNKYIFTQEELDAIEALKNPTATLSNDTVVCLGQDIFAIEDKQDQVAFAIARCAYLKALNDVLKAISVAKPAMENRHMGAMQVNPLKSEKCARIVTAATLAFDVASNASVDGDEAFVEMFRASFQEHFALKEGETMPIVRFIGNKAGHYRFVFLKTDDVETDDLTSDDFWYMDDATMIFVPIDVIVEECRKGSMQAFITNPTSEGRRDPSNCTFSFFVNATTIAGRALVKKHAESAGALQLKKGKNWKGVEVIDAKWTKVNDFGSVAGLNAGYCEECREKKSKEEFKGTFPKGNYEMYCKKWDLAEYLHEQGVEDCSHYTYSGTPQLLEKTGENAGVRIVYTDFDTLYAAEQAQKAQMEEKQE